VKALHTVTVMGRELQVRTSAQAEHVREIEAFVNNRISEVQPLVKGGDPQVIAILTLMNLAESYLALDKAESSGSGLEDRVKRLLRHLEEV
jgi:cell division protein ZapA